MINDLCSLASSPLRRALTFQDTIPWTHDPNLCHQLSVADLSFTSCLCLSFLTLFLSSQAWSACPWQTWTGRPEKTTPWSSRPKTWAASWGGSPVPLQSTSRSATSMTTRPCLTRVRGRMFLLTALLSYCFLYVFVFCADSLCSPLYLNPHHLFLIPPDTLTAEKKKQKSEVLDTFSQLERNSAGV